MVAVETTPSSMAFWAISSQSMNLMAPLGHCSAQRPQEMHLVDVPGLGVDVGHVPRAGGRAHAAADAHVLVDNTSAGFLIGVNGVNGTILGALRIGALLAGGYRELAVAEDAVVGIDAGAEVVVVPHAHAGDGLLSRAIILQGAHHLAALAAGAASAVGDDHFRRSGAQLDAARGDGGGGHAPGGEPRRRPHQAGNAATGHGEHGATGKEGLLLLGGRR